MSTDRHSEIREEIARALRIDQEGLTALVEATKAEPLSSALGAAAELLLGINGRLVISGIGKSGHVGRKLAASFSSTGTPAYFVHGAEASHGDLGTIRKEDCVLVISWSGGTRELSDLVRYCQRFGVPLISMTGNPEGSISRAADITLTLPKVREACPHNLAPTTSTLLQMAMGDALAVTLLKLRGFSESAFQDFHPGGKLGASLMAIDELLVTGSDMPLVAREICVADTIDELSNKGLGIVGITDKDKLVGVVTDGDIRRFLGRSGDLKMQEVMQETTAGDIMTSDPVCFSAGLLAGRALNSLQSKKISTAFVVDDAGQPTGVITTLALLGAGVG